MKYKLHALSAALTMGLLWGLVLFLWTLLAAYNGYAIHIIEMVEGLYPWYTVTYGGAIWGLIWGFVDFFVATYIVVYIYNAFVKKLGKK